MIDRREDAESWPGMAPVGEVMVRSNPRSPCGKGVEARDGALVSLRSPGRAEWSDGNVEV